MFPFVIYISRISCQILGIGNNINFNEYQMSLPCRYLTIWVYKGYTSLSMCCVITLSFFSTIFTIETLQPIRAMQSLHFVSSAADLIHIFITIIHQTVQFFFIHCHVKTLSFHSVTFQDSNFLTDICFLLFISRYHTSPPCWFMWVQWLMSAYGHWLLLDLAPSLSLIMMDR